MPRTYLIFGDIEGKLDVLRVECDRKGRYHVHKLIQKSGLTGNMMKWREQLSLSQAPLATGQEHGRTARIWLLAKPAGVIIPRQDRRTVASGCKPDVRARSLGNL